MFKPDKHKLAAAVNEADQKLKDQTGSGVNAACLCEVTNEHRESLLIKNRNVSGEGAAANQMQPRCSLVSVSECYIQTVPQKQTLYRLMQVFLHSQQVIRNIPEHKQPGDLQPPSPPHTHASFLSALHHFLWLSQRVMFPKQTFKDRKWSLCITLSDGGGPAGQRGRGGAGEGGVASCQM